MNAGEKFSLILIAILSLAMVEIGLAADTRNPEETVDAFHQGLSEGDAASVLSVMARSNCAFISLHRSYKKSKTWLKNDAVQLHGITP